MTGGGGGAGGGRGEGPQEEQGADRAGEGVHQDRRGGSGHSPEDHQQWRLETGETRG